MTAVVVVVVEEADADVSTSADGALRASGEILCMADSSGLVRMRLFSCDTLDVVGTLRKVSSSSFPFLECGDESSSEQTTLRFW